MPDGGIFRDEDGHYAGTPKPSESRTITYSITDDVDGGHAVAKYVLRIHEPIEKVREDVVGGELLPCSVTGVPAINGSDSVDETGDYMTQGTVTTEGWSIGTQSDFSLTDLLPFVGSSIPPALSYSWSISTEISSSFTVGRNLTQFQKAIPKAQLHGDKHYFYFRHFLPEGEHKLFVDDPAASPNIPAEEMPHEQDWIKWADVPELYWDVVDINTPEGY